MTGIVYAATVEGTVKKVDGDKSTVVVASKDNKDVAVTVIKDAKITLDSKKAKLPYLNEDQTVKITHEDN